MCSKSQSRLRKMWTRGGGKEVGVCVCVCLDVHERNGLCTDSCRKGEETRWDFISLTTISNIPEALALKNRSQVFSLRNDGRTNERSKKIMPEMNELRCRLHVDNDENENYSRWKILICVGWKISSSTWPKPIHLIALFSAHFILTIFCSLSAGAVLVLAAAFATIASAAAAVVDVVILKFRYFIRSFVFSPLFTVTTLPFPFT